MNKYEKHLLRNDINEICIVELSREFWRDKDGWPDWFKERAHKLADTWKPFEEDYDHGFIMYSEKVDETSPDGEYSYEDDWFKPILFYGYNRHGMWDLTEDDSIGYFPGSGRLIFGPRWMFDPFFIVKDNED